MPALLAIAAVDHPGGAEIGLLRLLPRLAARGWTVTLTTPSEGPLSARAREAGLAVEHLPVGGLGRGAGARALLSFPRVRTLARRHDVTYLNGTVCGRLLPALNGRRTVLHVHDIVDRVPRFWAKADVVLADSQAVADALGGGIGAHVVGCPIEPDPAHVPAPWQRNGRPVVGFVGRIEPRKGALDFARAAPAIEAAGAHVVLVGDDPFDSDPAYAQEVERAGLESYGWIDDAAGVMDQLDVLVVPSRQEPFGTVLAEAMNAGTPVVATRVGGLAEVVEDGVTGRLVEPGDPAALAAAVAEVLARRDEMGAAGRERARRWHADVYTDRVEALIAP